MGIIGKVGHSGETWCADGITWEGFRHLASLR